MDGSSGKAPLPIPMSRVALLQASLSSLGHLVGTVNRLAFVLTASSVLACSASPEEARSQASLGSSSADPSQSTSASSSSGLPDLATTQPATNGDFIPPPVDTRPSSVAVSGDDACRLAILGDPGSNPGANFALWIEDRGPIVDRYGVGPDLQAFTSSDLQTYDVLLLDRLAPGTEHGIAPSDLASWVQNGGRVIALSGYGDYPEIVEVQNALLAPLMLGFVSTSPVWGPISQFAQHPITAGLQSLTFVGGRAVIHQPADEVIMTIGDPGQAVGVVAQRGSGRLFLFGDEWVTFDSEWVAMPEIEQFWVNIFDWLGGCKLLPPSMVR